MPREAAGGDQGKKVKHSDKGWSERGKTRQSKRPKQSFHNPWHEGMENIKAVADSSRGTPREPNSSPAQRVRANHVLLARLPRRPSGHPLHSSSKRKTEEHLEANWRYGEQRSLHNRRRSQRRERSRPSSRIHARGLSRERPIALPAPTYPAKRKVELQPLRRLFPPGKGSTGKVGQRL